MADVSVGEYPVTNAVPPVVAANQPANVYPVRVGAAGNVNVEPVTNEPLLTAVPNCELYVTTFEAAVHFAYRVVSAVRVTPDCETVYVVPVPLAAVAQPTNE